MNGLNILYETGLKGICWAETGNRPEIRNNKNKFFLVMCFVDIISVSTLSGII